MSFSRSDVPLALAMIAGLVAPRLAAGQDSLPALLQRTGTFRAREIRESSGVAVSRVHPGLLWTHNDSGDGPFLYAINISGDLLGVVRVRGARAEDWEDISLARCPNRSGSCLYIGDIGDNPERRKSVRVYVVSEPDPPKAIPWKDTLETAPAHELTIKYPDRSHDAEALYVDRDGNATIITKGRTGPFLRYGVPSAAFQHDTVTATLVDTLPGDGRSHFAEWSAGGSANLFGVVLLPATLEWGFAARRTSLLDWSNRASGGSRRLSRRTDAGPHQRIPPGRKWHAPPGTLFSFLKYEAMMGRGATRAALALAAIGLIAAPGAAATGTGSRARGIGCCAHGIHPSAFRCASSISRERPARASGPRHSRRRDHREIRSRPARGEWPETRSRRRVLAARPAPERGH
jgi:hypothetical protein